MPLPLTATLSTVVLFLTVYGAHVAGASDVQAAAVAVAVLGLLTVAAALAGLRAPTN
ncbi:hypothetical protein C9F11_38265 [Streptomyces sp. YIM 121038]|uniref:hypothetical protein n=1 Tax=Streptomyces sp. YIM 121038 TaxID=2136401 RepID=UPI001163C375|nr:hypothetical protein [Streptomyces sp. YIM 121038]QCX81236.1 hypothetical protein C9F11_38265 [Streptomyces sp. YIM 121038]